MVIMVKIISLFNNKGGVGKSTLGFHLGHALGEMGGIKSFLLTSTHNAISPYLACLKKTSILFGGKKTNTLLMISSNL